MAAKIITVAQRKGGAGKTTLAANLAVVWAMAGSKVVAIDIDPQQSLSFWFQARTNGRKPPEADLTVSQVPGWRVRNEVERLARQYDFILVDSAPHDETEARVAIRTADLVVVPIQPSPMDVWASRQTLDVARQENVPTLLVLNRVPQRARLMEAMVEQAAALGSRIAENRVGNRIIFASAMSEGRGVAEMQPRGPAAQEVGALASEIEGVLA